MENQGGDRDKEDAVATAGKGRNAKGRALGCADALFLFTRVTQRCLDKRAHKTCTLTCESKGRSNDKKKGASHRLLLVLGHDNGFGDLQRPVKRLQPQ